MSDSENEENDNSNLYDRYIEALEMQFKEVLETKHELSRIEIKTKEFLFDNIVDSLKKSIEMPCPNVVKGCRATLRINELKKHVVNNCDQFTCLECRKVITNVADSLPSKIKKVEADEDLEKDFPLASIIKIQNNKLLLTGKANGELGIYNPDNGNKLAFYKNINKSVSYLALTQINKNQFIAAELGTKGVLNVFDIPNDLVSMEDNPIELQVKQEIVVSNEGIRFISNISSNVLICVTEKGNIVIYNLSSDKSDLIENKVVITSMLYLTKKKMLLCGDILGGINCFNLSSDLKSVAVTQFAQEHLHKVNCLYQLTNDILISASTDGIIKLWKLGKNDSFLTINTNCSNLTNLEYNNDNEVIIVSYLTNLIKIYQIDLIEKSATEIKSMHSNKLISQFATGWDEDNNLDCLMIYGVNSLNDSIELIK